MSLSEWPARALYWLQGLPQKERRRRKTAEALCGSHRPDLSDKDRAEIAAHEQMAHVWRTGEFPTVTFDHAEPIGPREPVPTFYADLLAESSTWMSRETLDRLEGPTGVWRREDLERSR